MKNVDVGGFQRVNWDAKAAAAAAAAAVPAFLQLSVRNVLCLVVDVSAGQHDTAQHLQSASPAPVILLINVAAMNYSAIKYTDCK